MNLRFMTDAVCSTGLHIAKLFSEIALRQHLIRQPYGLPPSPQGEGFFFMIPLLSFICKRNFPVHKLG